MSKYCLQKGEECQFVNESGYCSITACIKSISNITSIEPTPKSYAELIAEETNIQKVVEFLEGHGIQIKTEYGFYRDTYDILKDISEHWEQLKA